LCNSDEKAISLKKFFIKIPSSGVLKVKRLGQNNILNKNKL
jgi:hypothetical protein